MNQRTTGSDASTSREAKEPAGEPPSSVENRDASGGAQVTSRATFAISPVEPPAGRLAVLSSFAVAAAAIPIPLLPDQLVHRVRGAVIQDVASRHGLSLTSEARAALAEAHRESPARAIAKRAALLLGRRVLGRLGPLAAVSSVVQGYEVFALGHLFERYVERVRPAGAIRIQVEQARRVREAIDRASIRALAPSTIPRSMTMPEPVDDLRDEFTRWIDTLLLTGASLPGYLTRRLEAAFDAVCAEMPDLSTA